jgi:hypothetical protein
MTAIDTQPRERAVPCRECHRPTWNVSAFCDRHDEHSR